MKIKSLKRPSDGATLFFLLLLFIALLVFAGRASAATLTVTNGNDSGGGSLRERIGAAANGDTIVFAGDVSNIHSVGQITIDKTLTIHGRGRGITRINHDTSVHGRIFAIGVNGNVTMRELAIVNGRLDSNYEGAGISSRGSLHLFDCEFSGNGGQGFGGAIYTDGFLNVTRTHFAGNWAFNGGAIFATAPGDYAQNPPSRVASITDSTFENNSASNQGGAVFNKVGTYMGSTVRATRSSFINNDADDQGGGLYNYSSSSRMEISNCTIVGNSSGGAGAGFFNRGGDYYGGSGYSYGGRMYIENSTIYGNSAGGEGGGGYNGQNQQANIFEEGHGWLYLDGVILGRNGSSQNDDLAGVVKGGSFNLVHKNHRATLPNGPVITGQDPNLQGPDWYGGPTKTMRPNSGSPVINAGAQSTTNVGTDQRGFHRVGGGRVEIGAYEIQDATQSGSLYMVNSTADWDRGGCYVGACTMREAIKYAPNGSAINVDWNVFPANSTMTIGSELVIDRNLTIDVAGIPGFTIDANNTWRQFYIRPGATLTLNGVRLTRGRVTDGHHGGCIANEGALIANQIRLDGCSSQAAGGGIANWGSHLTLNDSEIINSTAPYGGALFNGDGRTTNINRSVLKNNTATANGGAIDSNGTVNIERSLLSGNTAAGRGGALSSNVLVVLNNMTVSGNTSSGGPGGGVASTGNGRLYTTNATISANNSGSHAGGGVYSEGPYYARNTIVARNTGNNSTDVAGTIYSYGYNLIGSTNGNAIVGSGEPGLTLAGNILNVNPMLTPLANNGGPMQTHMIAANSPAVNAGDPSNSFNTDQRGAARPLNGRADIGAVETNVAINQTAVNHAPQGVFYSFNLSATTSGFAMRPAKSNVVPEMAPFTFSHVAMPGQQLPPGLNLSSAGVLSGTPNTPGIYVFTVRVVDGANGMAGTRQYQMRIFGPTAASVTVSGRVFDQAGRFMQNAVVVLTDMNGNARTTVSGGFGYYSFEEVEVGIPYVIYVNSKRYTFEPRMFIPSDDVTDMDLRASP